MKLYARITNEKGRTDGMGGDKNLTLEITGVNQLLARVLVFETNGIYQIEMYPVAYPDTVHLDVKGHGYKLTRKACTHVPKCEEQEEGRCKAY